MDVRSMEKVMADPLFIVAPHRSFTSVICAMLGQHPQMYGLPEVSLFVADTMDEWWLLTRRGRAILAHGLLRAIAQVYLGKQTEETIEFAWRWIRRRRHWSTDFVFQELAEIVHPSILIDKSPSTVFHRKFLERSLKTFPRAKFIHLLRHPRSYGESVLGTPLGKIKLAGYNSFDFSTHPPTLDPQQAWYVLHMNICSFLATLPAKQKLRLRGEELLAQPDRHLREITDWLGLRTDAQAIDRMKHPERSPFACFGPPGALFGNDPTFLARPVLRPDRARLQWLEGPLGWREDGMGFSAKVKQLAWEFGYT
jgi:hypothetical protein